MRARFVAILSAAGLLTMACNGVVDPANNVTDTFTGTIPVQGTTIPGSPWSTSKTGEYTIKVTSLTPNNGVFFGTVLSYAAGDGTCVGSLTPIQTNSFGTVNTPVMSGAIYPGSYCVFLFDVGAFTAPETFTMTVSHP
ncbi:MAG TPA: hypothetical protein VGY48_27255 [Vicinamibacterales bacterium]|jgi:hypothetical protein|nr:hypothetical protein [Vicinamibacterales bacterium]